MNSVITGAFIGYIVILSITPTSVLQKKANTSVAENVAKYRDGNEI